MHCCYNVLNALNLGKEVTNLFFVFNLKINFKILIFFFHFSGNLQIPRFHQKLDCFSGDPKHSLFGIK